jgi:2'-5' RNA ligase
MPDGFGTPDLECVMLDLEPLPIREIYGRDLNEKDFFYGDIPELKYAQGPVAEEKAHVTLLFGIHPSDTYETDVLNVLADWEPSDIFVSRVGYFPSSIEGQDYKAIVGEVFPSVNLLLARKRLETLPHTNTFKDYKPHVTLAYIRGKADEKVWIRRMSAYFQGRVLYPTGLNLGHD